MEREKGVRIRLPSRRLLVQLPLGYASGLPLLLSLGTLGTWLTAEGATLSSVGTLSLVGLFYNWKPLWAPLFDRFALPFLGRRRGWLLLLQLLCAAAIFGLGNLQPATSPLRAALLASLLALPSASLDVVTDAYRSEILQPQESATGVALFVFGYRCGMLTAGALVLMLVGKIGWPAAYSLAGLTMGIGPIATLLSPEPPPPQSPPRRLVDAYLHPLRDLATRPGILAIIGLLSLYSIGVRSVTPMQQPFLLRSGFSLDEIALVNKGVGLLATLLGTALAGALVPRLGTRRALLFFGVGQLLVHCCWVALALCGHQPRLFMLTVATDQLLYGLAATALTGYMAQLCQKGLSAAQYAALHSISSLGGTLLGSQSGWLAERLGWPLFFAASSAIALPALLILPRLPPIADEQPAR